MEDRHIPGVKGNSAPVPSVFCPDVILGNGEVPGVQRDIVPILVLFSELSLREKPGRVHLEGEGEKIVFLIPVVKVTQKPGGVFVGKLCIHGPSGLVEDKVRKGFGAALFLVALQPHDVGNVPLVQLKPLLFWHLDAAWGGVLLLGVGVNKLPRLKACVPVEKLPSRGFFRDPGELFCGAVESYPVILSLKAPVRDQPGRRDGTAGGVFFNAHGRKLYLFRDGFAAWEYLVTQVLGNKPVFFHGKAAFTGAGKCVYNRDTLGIRFTGVFFNHGA